MATRPPRPGGAPRVSLLPPSPRAQRQPPKRLCLESAGRPDAGQPHRASRSVRRTCAHDTPRHSPGRPRRSAAFHTTDHGRARGGALRMTSMAVVAPEHHVARSPPAAFAPKHPRYNGRARARAAGDSSKNAFASTRRDPHPRRSCALFSRATGWFDEAAWLRPRQARGSRQNARGAVARRRGRASTEPRLKSFVRY